MSDKKMKKVIGRGMNGAKSLLFFTTFFHRWGYFPSFSAGWVVSNEKFMEKTSSWLDFLKIRAGWGQNGNAASVGNFRWMGSFTYGDFGKYSFGNDRGDDLAGTYSSRLPNEELTWETSEQMNIGLDARFLSGKLGFTFDWYSKKTKDLLVEVPVDASTGFSTMWKNAGTVKNTGIEVALNWQDQIGKDLKPDFWSAWWTFQGWYTAKTLI